MATAPEDMQPLDIREQLIRIDKMQAEIQKVMRETQKIAQDTRLATPQMFFQGGLATAALLGAGAAIAKLFS